MNLNTKAAVAIWLAAVAGFAAGIMAISLYLQYQLIGELEAGKASLEAANANDERQAAVAALFLFVVAASVIAYLVWAYSANKTLRSTGISGLKFTPTLAVGVHLIPIYNLWAGYEVMKEIWSAAHARESGIGYSAPRRNAIITAWWLVWIGGGLFTRMANFYRKSDATLDDLRTSSMLSMIGALVFIVSAAIHINVLRRATAAIQTKILQRRAPTGQTGPASPS